MPTASLSQSSSLHNSPDQIRAIALCRGGWAWFDKRIITRYGRLLGPNGIAVYMALTVHADGELQTCFPSYKTIAKQLNISRPTVLKAIKLIIALYLSSKQWTQSPEGDPGPNLYALLHLPNGPLELTGLPTWATIDALEDDAPPPKDLPPLELSTGEEGVVNEIDHPSQPPVLPVVKEVDPNKNLLERDIQNKSNGVDVHVHGVQKPQKPQPSSYGRRGYTPMTPPQLAERKAFLRQQAAQLCPLSPEREDR